MRKVVIIRGVPGSGKSTYAKKLINEFLADNSESSVLHIEYDMIREELYNGNYIWDNDDDTKVRTIAEERIKTFINEHKKLTDNALLVISNVSPRVTSFKEYLDYAKGRGFKEEVYLINGLHKNTHNVPLSAITGMYETIKANPYPSQIIVDNEYNPELILVKEILEKGDFDINNSKEVELFLTMYSNFLRVSVSSKYPELSVAKYNQIASFDGVWNEGIRKCRGLVINKDYQIVSYPFIHHFNYSEVIARNGYSRVNFTKYPTLNLVSKINGFLGVATYVSGYEGSYNNQVIYSTTGTLDSDYAVIVEKHLSKYKSLFKSYPNYTFMFEIIDESDPHIVTEELGEVLIGIRNSDRVLLTESEIDELVSKSGLEIKRPECITISTEELLSTLNTSKLEGYMVKDPITDETLCKFKTPYYQVIKHFGRVGNDPIKAKKLLLTRLSNYKSRKGTLSRLSNALRNKFDKFIDHIESEKENLINLDNIARIRYIREWINKNIDIEGSE